MSIRDDPEYRALLACSARIGADCSLVQAAGGNVSLKRGGTMWIKASGTWLAEAEERNIMVPVDLWPMLTALDRGEGENMTPFVSAGVDLSGLRPSIETSLHGVLPHPVVIHVHCVETIAWAVCANAERALATRLAGLAWCFVPYVRPGPPLALALRRRMADGTDVVVLGNHGLVVGAETTPQAEALVRDVQRRLARGARPAPGLPRHWPVLEGHAPAADVQTHALALDPLRLSVARLGSFYPDHVIFLGPGIAETPGPAPLVVHAEHGAYLRTDASVGAAALARCLSDVTGRLDPDESLVTLTAEDEAALLDWDAEKYRQSLNRSAGQPPRGHVA